MKKNIYILLIILFAGQQHCFAQGFSACFSLDYNRGCAPLKVTATSCSGNPSVQYNFGDGTGYTFNPVHTYSTVGNYKIIQLVNTGLVFPPSDTISHTVQVLPLPNPDFKIFVCKNLQVTVNSLNNVYDRYVIDWGDGSLKDTITGSSSITHTTTSGLKNVLVKGIYLSGPSCSSPVISTQVLPIQNLVKPDIINLVVNGNGLINLTLNPTGGQRYILDMKTGASPYVMGVDTFPAQTVEPIPNLDTDNLQYCFKIRSFDDCGNEIPSEEVCSNIVTATPQNNHNLVTWTNYPGGFSNYTLYKGVSNISSQITNTYTDNNVVCGVNDCYFVVTDLTALTAAGNPIQSLSYRSCAKAISTDVPPAITNLNSSVSGSSINLSWDVPTFVPAASQYQIGRSVNSGPYDMSYAVSNTNSYTDNGVDANTNQYCYMVVYTPCTVPSPPSAPTCNSYLSGNETNGINLTWTPYSCPGGAVADYTLERLDPSTGSVVSFEHPVSSPYTDTQADPNTPVLKYRINISCPASSPTYSNVLEINHELKLFLPTAFTPDGDGNNDYFAAKGKYIKDFKMTVFNRWGEIVFYTEEMSSGWDGKYKGDIASMDAYAYRVEATDNFGNKLSRKGTVTLLR